MSTVEPIRNVEDLKKVEKILLAYDIIERESTR